ncbi:EF-P 5-aminopentanol modification-associated protein YfmH [Planctomycetota bacterium]
MTLSAHSDEFVKETVYAGTLDCGLQVMVMPKKNFRKKCAVLGVNFGSIDNCFRSAGNGGEITIPAGVAHFLEHKMFEKEDGDVFLEFSRTGANANAGTSFTSTKYLFSCTTGFEKNLEILMDFVQEPYFTEATVTKEKGIIAEELRMYNDSPGWVVFFNLLRALYHNHPVRIDIGGTLESIQEISHHTLHKCWQTFYHPGNMGMFVAGNVDPEQVFAQVEANYAPRAYQELSTERIMPTEPDEVAEKCISRAMPVKRAKFLLGFKDRNASLRGRDFLKRHVVMNLLMSILFGGSSEFYLRHYESGLIDDDTFGAEFMAEREFGVCMVGGDTEDPRRLEAVIVEEFEKAMTTDLIERHFARNRKKALGKTIGAYNYPESCASALGGAFFNGYDIFDPPKILQKIQVRDFRDHLQKHYDINDYAVSLVTGLES